MNTCVCLKERNLKRGFIVGWGRFVFRASLATRARTTHQSPDYFQVRALRMA